jgi:shikimate kinase
MYRINKPVFFIGIMGAGKSYLAKMLGTHYGVPVFDTDFMIEEASGLTISAIFAGPKGQERFREMERKLLQETHWPEASIVSCGGGLPCFFNNMDFMLQTGMVVWLNPPVSELVSRLWKQKSHRPLLSSLKSEEELAQKLRDLLNDRKQFYARAHIIVDDIQNDNELIKKMEGYARIRPAP